MEELNFAPRVKIPVLMINGRYDHIYPVESSQKPFFKLLGTPEKDKVYLVFDGGHTTPRNEIDQGRIGIGWIATSVQSINQIAILRNSGTYDSAHEEVPTILRF